jgi:uncharacterized protein
MTIYYCDSSVLVKRHMNESGSQWFRQLVDQQNISVFTTQISVVEVCSALNRRLRENVINLNDYHSLVAQSTFLFGSKYEVIAISEQLIELACSALERHVLRAFDAIHLATAMMVNDRLIRLNEPTLIFLATDQRLLTAAIDEGLSTFNPANIP